MTFASFIRGLAQFSARNQVRPRQVTMSQRDFEELRAMAAVDESGWIRDIKIVIAEVDAPVWSSEEPT